MIHSVEKFARPIIKCRIPKPIGTLPKYAAGMHHPLSRDNRGLDDEPEASPDSQNAVAPFDTESIQVAARFRRKVLHLIGFTHLAVFHIWRIPNYYIEPAPAHDFVELDKPVKRFVAASTWRSPWLPSRCRR